MKALISSSPSSLTSPAKRPVTSLAALTVAFGALTASAVVAHANPPVAVTDTVGDASDPYANVASALGVGGSLLRDDDIVVTLGNEIGEQMQDRWVSSMHTTGAVNPQCADGAGCNYRYAAYDNEETSTVGRFFNIATDSTVQLPAINETSYPGNVTVDVLGSAQQLTSRPLPYGTDATTIARSAVADFTGDGYDDIVVAYADWQTQSPFNGRARIAHAADVNNPSAGLVYGPESNLGFVYGVRSVAAGDFNNDGKQDVAVLFIDGGNKPNISVYNIDPNLNVVLQATLTIQDPIDDASVDAPMQLIAGTFTPGGGQQLALATQEASTGKMKIRILNFTDATNAYLPVEQGNYVTEKLTNVKMAAGRFDWSSNVDTLAVMNTYVDNGSSTSHVDVVRVDPTSLQPKVTKTVNVAKDLHGSTDGNYVALDIAVGNFTNNTVQIVDGVATHVTVPDEQIAVATGYCQGQDRNVNQFQVKDVFTLNVSADGTAATTFSENPLLTRDGTAGKVTRMAIAAADLQGRSKRLGPGYKVVIDKVSPTMMLAQPPSHVDAVQQPDGSFMVINKSFSPNSFSADFTTTTGSSISDSETYSHGWTWGAEESINATARLGTKGDNVHDSLSLSAMQDWSKQTDNTYGTQKAVNATYSEATTTNDVVVFDDGPSYLYVYQVVGQTTCPEGQDTCDDSAKVPLTVSFTVAGPQTTTTGAADGLSWYQPVWENGNVLSYPANAGQLTNGSNSTLALAQSHTYAVDSSKATETTTWSGSQSESNSVTSTKVLKEDAALSVGAIYTDEIGSESVDVSLDVNHSSTTNSLKTKSATLSTASTLSIYKGAVPDAAYSFSPAVLGQNAPLNYFEPENPDYSWATPINSNGITSFGPMRTAYTVALQPDSWWTQTYEPSNGAFDIALNHPMRWRNVNSETITPAPTNCITLGTGYMDCATPNPRNPANPMQDDFHSMRGFFVFPSAQSNPNDFANQGMQAQFATQGDQLTLEARVYNYSLNAMPAGASVYANFYGMPMANNGLPIDYVSPGQPGGKSFLIGQWANPGGIQPYTDDPNVSTPNFVVASTNFDTSKYTGDYAFWVVVWAEDASGNMLPELPGKGLNAHPRALSLTPAFMDAAALEPTVTNTWKQQGSVSDSDTISFSNNVAFYDNVFTITPQSGGLLGAAPASGRQGDVKALAVTALDLPHTEIQRGDLADIKATISNTGEPMQIATAYFYDGDPSHGGKTITARRIPYIESNGQRSVQVHYAPATCGLHDIYMNVTHRGLATKSVKAVESIQVDCPTAGDGGAPSANVDGGIQSDAGASGEAGVGPGTGGGSKDDGGGCTVAPGASTGFGWLGPFGAVIGGFLARRKRKA
jgi:hypothetical protein